MEASASVIVFTLHDIPVRAERGISAGIAWDLIFFAIAHEGERYNLRDTCTVPYQLI